MHTTPAAEKHMSSHETIRWLTMAYHGLPFHIFHRGVQCPWRNRFLLSLMSTHTTVCNKTYSSSTALISSRPHLLFFLAPAWRTKDPWQFRLANLILLHDQNSFSRILRSWVTSRFPWAHVEAGSSCLLFTRWKPGHQRLNMYDY